MSLIDKLTSGSGVFGVDDSSRISAEAVALALGLEPLPHEGGFFRQTWRSGETIPAGALPGRPEARHVGTCIYALLTPVDFSAMHRLRTDEVWHFYAGDPLEQLLLHPSGASEVIILGRNFLDGQKPQHVAPAGAWQGTRLVPGGRWALFGATMAPGFDWNDFELGDCRALSLAYPERGELIASLTREPHAVA